MMLNKLLANKKVVITIVAILLAICVGAVIMVSFHSKETDGKKPGTETEQGREDTDDSGLEVLKPDEVDPENSSDASGSWENEPNSGTQTDSSNTGNETDKVPSNDNVENNQENKDEEQEKEEDILEDDILWGDIY